MTKHAVVALLLLTAPAVAQEPKPYTNAKWGFSALLPYEVKEQVGAEGGLTVSAANAEDTIAYMLSIFPIADEVLAKKKTDQILEDAVKGAIGNVQGKLLSKTDITLNGFPGKQFDIQSKDFVAKCRIYLVNKRMYLPMVIAAPALKLPIEADAFHKSFKLIGQTKK